MRSLASILLGIILTGCGGKDGSTGPAGPAGAPGKDGADGVNGVNGTSGRLTYILSCTADINALVGSPWRDSFVSYWMAVNEAGDVVANATVSGKDTYNNTGSMSYLTGQPGATFALNSPTGLVIVWMDNFNFTKVYAYRNFIFVTGESSNGSDTSFNYPTPECSEYGEVPNGWK